MHADRIDAQLRHMRSRGLRIGVRGIIRAEAGVHAPDPQPPGVGEEMAVLDADKAVRARRPAVQP